jgi:Fe-S-cluster-containing hydrogenase component 2
MPYKRSNEYMSWSECRNRCPHGAIHQSNGHYWIDSKLCDRCQDLPEYGRGGIFVHNSAQQLLDFNGYWQKWFASYQKLVQQLHGGGGQ